MAAIEIAPGYALCAGRYRLERRLGAGGMASVWRATDAHLHRGVAVKILSDTLAGDDAYVARFRREARLAASLSHPRLVQVFDFGEESGRPFLVMELIDGPTLAGLLRREVAPDIRPVEVASDLLDALAHVHDAGIVHRDIKPANVLMAPDGRVRLTDFGVAQPPDATELTGTGLVIGTLRYLAPELVAGGPATIRSDLFALGRLLREVVDAGRQDAGPELHGLIARLIREDPAERPQSAAQALALLSGAETAQTVAASLPPAARAPVQPRRPRPPRIASSRAAGSPPRAPASRRAVSLLISVLVAGVIIAAVAVASSGGKGSAAPRPAPASAPLSRQLEAIGRALDGISR